jgi:hypothetical protein
MSFGRNPHVAKAEAAEQKASGARDSNAGKQAWLEAARQWDRAADRETDAKRKQQYAERGQSARAQADGEAPQSDLTDSDGLGPAERKASSLLN